MANKKADFRVLSEKTCKVKGCHKKIKQNVIDRNPQADMCYLHYQKLIRKNPGYKDVRERV